MPIVDGTKWGVAHASVTVLILTVFVASSRTAAEGSDSDKVVVSTTGDLGFSRGDEFYPIGMQANEFVRRFGMPAVQGAERLEYPDYGLVVLLDPTKAISGYVFSAPPRQTGEQSPPAEANVHADCGFGMNASYESVAKLKSNAEDEVVDRRHRTVFYPFGILEFQDDHLSVLRVGFAPGEHEQLIDAVQRTRRWHERRGKPEPVPAPPPPPRPGPKLPEEAKYLFRDLGDAKKVILVVDATGSMLNQFREVRRVVARALASFAEDRSFNIVVFQGTACVAFGKGSLLPATPKNKSDATAFCERISPRGETDPVPAMKLAFAQHPDLIYFLTDGDFNDNYPVLAALRRLNEAAKVHVSTIEIRLDVDQGVTPFTSILQRIAKENGGVYSYATERPPTLE